VGLAKPITLLNVLQLLEEETEPAEKLRWQRIILARQHGDATT
jgi:hypothetical protein